MKSSSDMHRLKKKCLQSSSALEKFQLYTYRSQLKYKATTCYKNPSCRSLSHMCQNNYRVWCWGLKIWLRSVLQTPSRHPFQSIPADRHPPYWSWIWTWTVFPKKALFHPRSPQTDQKMEDLTSNKHSSPFNLELWKKGIVTSWLDKRFSVVEIPDGETYTQKELLPPKENQRVLMLQQYWT